MIYHGDCLAVLRTLPDCSVDAVVTDPPYGLSFMGKRWDYDVPSVEVWAECLRVLKPGGHLLAFAGTRTQHRMAVRIEDAGFEIRDMIAWVYSQGFPKSHNLDNLRGDKICGCSEPYAHNGTEEKPKCNVRPVRDANVPQAESAQEKRRQVLQPSVQKQGSSASGWQELSGSEIRRGQSCVEGRRNASSPEGELCSSSICESASGRVDHGAQGRLCHGAPLGNGEVDRSHAASDGSCASRRPRSDEQYPGESGAMAGQSKPQAMGTWPVCGWCGLPRVPSGLGTALKPALEPITMARKPLVGTVAANVLVHGTGALNIDGCRVATDDALGGGAQKTVAVEGKGEGWQRPWMHDAEAVAAHASRVNANVAKAEALGRWPANFIHDGSEEVLAGFPQTGPSKAASRGELADIRGNKFNAAGETIAGSNSVRGHNDNGGSAARFFYCAKASKRDRDAGCEGLEEKSGCVQNSSGRRFNPICDNTGKRIQDCGCGDCKWSEGTNPKSRNHHPTVKPTNLMRYLCRLVTPPGGTVLDPFMGSGSTGKAAILEGFRFIGIEREAEYVEIAKARIASAEAQPKQEDLF